ncbi:hypothetical protein OAS19_00060 [Altererythrobacter sp.]|nr:hypothetical protein [Altererythrobacter sp.]
MLTKKIALSLPALALLAACSQNTQDKAQEAAERAAADTSANAQVVGEAIEEGAIDTADAVSKGAANLADDLRKGDTEEPGPAPITGDNVEPAE